MCGTRRVAALAAHHLDCPRSVRLRSACLVLSETGESDWCEVGLLRRAGGVCEQLAGVLGTVGHVVAGPPEGFVRRARPCACARFMVSYVEGRHKFGSKRERSGSRRGDRSHLFLCGHTRKSQNNIYRTIRSRRRPSQHIAVQHIAVRPTPGGGAPPPAMSKRTQPRGRVTHRVRHAASR